MAGMACGAPATSGTEQRRACCTTTRRIAPVAAVSVDARAHHDAYAYLTTHPPTHSEQRLCRWPTRRCWNAPPPCSALMLWLEACWRCVFTAWSVASSASCCALPKHCTPSLHRHEHSKHGCCTGHKGARRGVLSLPVRTVDPLTSHACPAELTRRIRKLVQVSTGAPSDSRVQHYDAGLAQCVASGHTKCSYTTLTSMPRASVNTRCCTLHLPQPLRCMMVTASMTCFPPGLVAVAAGLVSAAQPTM